MATTPGDVSSDAAELVAAFSVYDRAVDVVSAWEMIFTESDTPLRRAVLHFERFPVVRSPSGESTPDFTVLYDDGSACIGEIAHLPLADEGVDALCAQLARYHKVTHVPGPMGIVKVHTVSVMLLVPITVGPPAIQRVIEERALNDDHPYAPERLPVVVQFVFDRESGKYIFQRIPDPRNGELADEGLPEDARLSGWFRRHSVNIRPDRFQHIKVTRRFVNDPIAPLYLAVTLWTKTIADDGAYTGTKQAVLEYKVGELAERLRREFGNVRASDVRRALELLAAAGLAERDGDVWRVQWREIAVAGEDRDFAQELARRAAGKGRGGSGKARGARVRRGPGPPNQESLF